MQEAVLAGEAFGIGQRIGKADAPEAFPLRIKGDADGRCAALIAKGADMRRRIDNVRIADDGLLLSGRKGRFQPRARAEQRREHIAVLPLRIDRCFKGIGRQAGGFRHETFGQIAAHDQQALCARGAQRIILPVQQRSAGKGYQTFGFVTGQFPQPGTATGRKNQSYHR